MAQAIEDYAMIGNCRSAALISRQGSIDWLCLPRFDAAACFAALLGDQRHGYWSLRPSHAARAQRHYRGDSLILETLWETATGRVRVLDFMPSREPGEMADPADAVSLIRLIEGLEGEVELLTEWQPRFDYGSQIPALRHHPEGAVTALAGPDLLVLRGLHAPQLEAASVQSRWRVKAGTVEALVMSYGASHWTLPAALQAPAELALSETFWQQWAAKIQKAGPWSDLVRRSLITLKGLSYLPTGGILAAATTSLPEQWGGARNWDYRYSWIRDSSLTLSALLKAGCHAEARAWRSWVARAVAGQPEQLQVMYGLAGERRLDEYELPWLPGYAGSRPVRVGNAAAGQLQLDIFGELMSVLEPPAEFDVVTDAEAVTRDLSLPLMAHLESIWQQADEGLWEIRGQPRYFTHSRIMIWLAFDRAAHSQHPLAAPHRARWAALAETVRAEVEAQGVDPEGGYFVQAYGHQELDASLLLAPLVGFISATDPRMLRTVAAIEQRLVRDGLVMRYDTAAAVDGLEGGEGAFLACSFWLVENYILQGRLDEAQTWFERLSGLCNDVGLLSEEYDPVQGRQLGNVPQAFSHVALIHAAYRLAAAISAQHEGESVSPKSVRSA